MAVYPDPDMIARMRIKSCEGKRRYVTEARARHVAKEMLQRGHGKMDAYFCQFCQGWHIGHGS